MTSQEAQGQYIDEGRRPDVLIVAGDHVCSEMLERPLAAEGFAVLSVFCGDAAVALASARPPSLILLDLGVPTGLCLSFFESLRAQPSLQGTPIIILSERNCDTDLERGFNAGVDDFVFKPFSTIELVARMRAQLRKASTSRAAPTLHFEGIVLNHETHRVHVNGQPIRLGPIEFRLMAVFIKTPGRIWSREELLEIVWTSDLRVETRTVDVHIGRLRKALNQKGSDYPIRTVRCAGYVLG